MDNVILSNKLFRNGLEDVELVKADVGREPVGVGEHIGLQIESMESGGSWNFVAKVDEPDATDTSASVS